MKLSVKNSKGKDQGELEVKFELIEGGKGTQAVHDTVDTVKGTMQETVSSVKEAFDLSRQVERHPWTMVGGSFALGVWQGEVMGVGRFAPAENLRADLHAALPGVIGAL